MTHRSSLFVSALVFGLVAAPLAAGGAGPDPAPVTVKGSVDKEVVRGVVKKHLPEVKACYERELAEKPELEGRVVVRFTIGGEGRVVAAVLETSTLGTPRAENCMVAAVRGWEFPKPASGEAVVSYPFAFAPR
jgi:TonB family protein